MGKESHRKILYLQFTNPAAFPPLENSAWLLAEKGWRVKFIGTEALGAESLKMQSHPNIEVWLKPFDSPGIRQKLNYVVFIFKAFKEILLSGYQYLYISDIFSCPAGWIASKFLGVRVLYHEHDTPDAAQSGFTRVLQWTRKKLSSSAFVCIVPQKERADRFLAEFSHSKVQVCQNMPLKNRAFSGKRLRDTKKFKLWYHGSLVSTLLPVSVLEAMVSLPKEVVLYFAGYEILGAPGFLTDFLNRAEQLGVKDRVFYEGVLSREPLYEKARSCDLGLALFSRKFREPMVGASNKPFDYMACGLPLLINDSAEWVEFFEKVGVAKSCNPESAESIAKAIRELSQAPEQVQSMREQGIRKIASEWNYEAQFAPIQKLLEA